MTSGTLPAGLTLSSAGVLSGTPSAAGTSNFTVQVTGGGTATKAFAVTVDPAALSITTVSPLPAGTAGTRVQPDVCGHGGHASVQLVGDRGYAAGGLTLSSAGVLSGTPTTAGTSNFTVQVTGGGTATKAFAVTVDPAALSITTVSPLPAGTAGSAYSQTLAASGGTPPYSWSVTAGTLPAGLTLSSAGVLSGTPSAAGTSNFTVQVTGGGTATKALSIAVSAPTLTFTIWPGTVPGTVDSGPDSAVELGVKFRSDTAGYITGIRFYKASTNTGTHVGNLWTSTGTRLATATFANETASGWQQVSFATPVAITANTVYVASYHTNTGHYSDDQNYFTGKGMDSPPLHALASGVSGVNGVYAYGSGSNFPSLGWNNTNYWVDVVLSATAPPPPTLSSIAVTPVNQTITIGATQQYTATGTYSDGSTQNLTSQAAWSSSSTGVAGITSAGLATGVSAGSTTITATLSGVTGSTGLTVQAVPFSITTSSLPGGTLNVSYSATLAATGGTSPYTWSIDERLAADGSVARRRDGRHLRDAHGRRHLQLHGPGDRFRESRADRDQGVEHRRRRSATETDPDHLFRFEPLYRILCRDPSSRGRERI